MKRWTDGMGNEQTAGKVALAALGGAIKGLLIILPVTWLAITYKAEIVAYLATWGIS